MIAVAMRNVRGALYRRWLSVLVRNSRWLVPGLGVKRWLLVTLAGTTLIGVGLAILILDIYRTAPETWWLPALRCIIAV
jgi:hypothetical protein